MIKKATAVLVAGIMAMMAVCCISVPDEVEGSTSLTGMNFDANDDQKVRNFTVNEGEYYGYAYTLTIGVAQVTSGASAATSYTKVFEKLTGYDTGNGSTSDTITLGGGAVSVTADASNIGSYNINVSRPTDDYIMELRVTMHVTVGTVQVDMDPLVFRMDVLVSESAVDDPEFKSMTFEVGKYAWDRVSESGTPVLGSIDLYHWYAEGLPEGLSMSENGYISGIAEATTTGTVAKLYIFGHEGNGEYHSEITIIVEAAKNNPNTFNYSLTGGAGGATNCYDYVAVQGNNVILTITPNKANSTLVVYSVDNNNHVYTTITSTGDNGNGGTTYKLSTAGSGCYKVVMKCNSVNTEGDNTEGDNIEETTYFHLYVIPAFDVVDADITIGST